MIRQREEKLVKEKGKPTFQTVLIIILKEKNIILSWHNKTNF